MKKWQPGFWSVVINVGKVQKINQWLDNLQRNVPTIDKGLTLFLFISPSNPAFFKIDKLPQLSGKGSENLLKSK
jgi:hypothetical protein